VPPSLLVRAEADRQGWERPLEWGVDAQREGGQMSGEDKMVDALEKLLKDARKAGAIEVRFNVTTLQIVLMRINNDKRVIEYLKNMLNVKGDK
jgi:hypothetical protein